MVYKGPERERRHEMRKRVHKERMKETDQLGITEPKRRWWEDQHAFVEWNRKGRPYIPSQTEAALLKKASERDEQNFLDRQQRVKDRWHGEIEQKYKKLDKGTRKEYEQDNRVAEKRIAAGHKEVEKDVKKEKKERNKEYKQGKKGLKTQAKKEGKSEGRFSCFR